MATHAIAKLYQYTLHLDRGMMQCNACCKCENYSRCSHSYLEPWWGRMVTLRQPGQEDEVLDHRLKTRRGDWKRKFLRPVL